MIVVNGNLVAQGSQFSLNDVEVVTATVDLEEVRTFRSAPSRGLQASKQEPYVRLEVDMRLSKPSGDIDPSVGPSDPIEPRYHTPEEEIALGPACWLWDYLRRSGSAGFFVPLSGGIDSCSTAVIVFSMCRQVMMAIEQGNQQVIQDVRKICAKPVDSDWLPSSAQEVCQYVSEYSFRLTLLTCFSCIFHTAFMGSQHSSAETRGRAKALAADIGAYHIDMNIDTVVSALTNLFTAVTNFQPRFAVHGGTFAENAALQNIQARIRMVISYLFAQMLPTVRQRPGAGGLLVVSCTPELSGVLGSNSLPAWIGECG